MTIAPARGAGDIEIARALFAEYGATISAEACLVGFDQELAALPGAYAPPAGEILLARDSQGTVVGCVALRALESGAAEMKRLYVPAAGRRGGVGRALVLAILECARGIGYIEVKLDSLPSMAAAQALYRALGFVEIERYNDNPTPGLAFMGKRL